MVKVFKLIVDASQYQWILPVDEGIWKTGQLLFECKSKADNWCVPTFYIHNPMRERGNFFHVGAGSFAFDQKVRDDPEMAEYFEWAGEILPIALESGERLYVLNVTECVNALDRDKTIYRRDPETKDTVSVEKYAFSPGRFTQSPIFKVPETCRGHVLTFSGHLPPHEEFYSAFQAKQFSGLAFEEVWAS